MGSVYLYSAGIIYSIKIQAREISCFDPNVDFYNFGAIVSGHGFEESVLLNLKSKQVASVKPSATVFLNLSLALMLGLAPAGALSDQLVWVLGSFSDGDTAQKVALEVQELTGQAGYVQTALVKGRAVHRALIDPGVTTGAQARTTALLSETAYGETWGFELDPYAENVSKVGADVPRQADAADAVEAPDFKNSTRPAAQPASDRLARQVSEAKQAAPRAAERARPSSRMDAMGVTSDYHPIRLKSDR